MRWRQSGERIYLTFTRILAWIALLARSDTGKEIDILVLRHQLAVLQRRTPRPRMSWADRALIGPSFGHPQVEIPNGRWRRPTRKIWAEVVGNAAYVDTPDEIPVSGTALVRATYFRTFPEAEFDYLENFAPVRLLVQTSSPYGWEPRP